MNLLKPVLPIVLTTLLILVGFFYIQWKHALLDMKEWEMAAKEAQGVAHRNAERVKALKEELEFLDKQALVDKVKIEELTKRLEITKEKYDEAYALVSEADRLCLGRPIPDAYLRVLTEDREGSGGRLPLPARE